MGRSIRFGGRGRFGVEMVASKMSSPTLCVFWSPLIRDVRCRCTEKTENSTVYT